MLSAVSLFFSDESSMWYEVLRYRINGNGALP